jgi:hypothetical protein
MCLVKEIVFITDIGKGFDCIKIIQHTVETDDRSKFLGCGAYHFPESFFKGTLADKKFFGQFLYAYGAFSITLSCDSKNCSTI